jgi:hypothetical protein
MIPALANMRVVSQHSGTSRCVSAGTDIATLRFLTLFHLLFSSILFTFFCCPRSGLAPIACYALLRDDAARTACIQIKNHAVFMLDHPPNSAFIQSAHCPHLRTTRYRELRESVIAAEQLILRALRFDVAGCGDLPPRRLLLLFLRSLEQDLPEGIVLDGFARFARTCVAVLNDARHSEVRFSERVSHLSSTAPCHSGHISLFVLRCSLIHHHHYYYYYHHHHLRAFLASDLRARAHCW